jgi:uncharacterized protein YutD|tara:strand:+ start:648 stop:758 length:111 start_codon:yes stop_codon:yes gene_type:complete
MVLRILSDNDVEYCDYCCDWFVVEVEWKSLKINENK